MASLPPGPDLPDIIVVGKPLPRLSCSPTAIDRLKERETGGLWDGKRLKLLPLGTPALAAYPDDVGVWTIGWGATGRSIFRGVRWTLLECEVRLEADVSSREAAIRAMLKGVACTPKQFEALLSLGFNIGVGNGGLATSTIIKLHRQGQYAEAAKRFASWKYGTVGGKKVVLSGLVTRRAEEAAVYRGGDWRIGE